MAVIKIEVEAAKETYELLLGLAQVVGSIKKALDDGFQPGSDIPKIIADSISYLVPAVAGFEDIRAEAVTDKLAFTQALQLGGFEIYRKIIADANSVP